MKQVLRVILSICLIAASIFGIYAGVLGAKDALNIQKYKTADGDAGLRQIEEELLPGVDQLTENLSVYLDGVGQVADGKSQLAAGYAEYAAGQAQLAAGAQQLREGEAALAAGQAEIDANTEAYNKGKELEGTLNAVYGLISQWNDAKNAVVNGTTSLLNANPFDVLNLGSQTVQAFVSLNERLFLSTARSLLSTDLITNTLGMSISIPDDAETFPTWFMGFVEDARAQLKMYEDGLVQLAEGKAQLEAGYAEYANGQAQLAAGAAQLADGEAQLADGLAQLSVFEQGEITLAVGLTRLLTQPAYENNYTGQVFYDGDLFYGDMVGQIFTNLLNSIQDPAGREVAANAIYSGFYDTTDPNLMGFPRREGDGGDKVCKSVLDIVRESIPGFNPATDLWVKNDDGSIRTENGYPLVNLDVARTIANAGRTYIEDEQTGAVTSEVMGKVIAYVLLLVASVIGLIAGILGLIGKGAFAGFGVVTCILGVAALVVTLIKKGFKGYAFAIAKDFEIDADGIAHTAWPWGHNVRDGVNAISGNQLFRGDLQLKAILIFAIVAFLFAIVALIAKKALKAAKAKKYSYTPKPAPAAAAAAPVAQPVAQPVYAAPVVETPVVEKVVVTEPVVEKVVVKTPAEIAAEAAAKAAAAQAAADAAAAEAAAAKAAADAAAAAAD